MGTPADNVPKPVQATHSVCPRRSILYQALWLEPDSGPAWMEFAVTRFLLSRLHYVDPVIFLLTGHAY